MKQEPEQTGFESLNEPDFVAGLKAGGDEGFDKLCIVAGPLLQDHISAYFPTLNNRDVEDIIQESLLQAYKDLAKYDPGESKLTTWLYRIAKRKALDMRKSLGRAKRVPVKRSNLVSIEDLPEKEHPTVEIAASPGEQPPEKKGRGPSVKGKATSLDEALSHLPEDERSRRIKQAFMTLGERERVILRATIQKASGKDIAARLGISVDNVRTIRRRAWEALISSVEEAASDG